MEYRRGRIPQEYRRWDTPAKSARSRYRRDSASNVYCATCRQPGATYAGYFAAVATFTARELAAYRAMPL
jgi:hypothetical protein